MSTDDSSVKYSDDLGKSAFVPTAVNKSQLTREQADIAKLCELIAVQPLFAALVWNILNDKDLL